MEEYELLKEKSRKQCPAFNYRGATTVHPTHHSKHPTNPASTLRRMAFFLVFFPVFARRRRMAPRENKRGGRGGESMPFFAVGLGGLASGCQLGWPVQLTTSASLSETAKQRRPTLLPTSFPRRLKLYFCFKAESLG